ncbi:Elongator complex protein 6, partial [Pseudolycoriella hygida]
MARSVVLACNLNELKDFMLIREDVGVDGSFLINCILGRNFLTPNSSTILVCLHHTYEHYTCAGKRLNLNLNDARSKGHLFVIDYIKDMACELNDISSFNMQPETLVNDLLDKIINTATMLLKNRPCVIILDDLHNCNVFEVLANTISDLAESEIIVHELTSGCSKEVDGRLVVKKCNGFDSEKTVLYKFCKKRKYKE